MTPGSAVLGSAGVLGAVAVAREVAVASRARRRALDLAPRATVYPPPGLERLGPVLPTLVAQARRRLGLPDGASDVAHATVLESIARALRSGASLPQAIIEVAAAGPVDGPADLRGVAERLRRGAPAADALVAWVRAGADEARVLAGAALTFGAELGGASARSLDAAASGLRDRAALGREVRALSAQARASALVMVSAPVVFVVLAGLADTRVPRALLTTPTGLTCLAAGVALDVAGAAWMAAMARRVR